MRHRQSSPEDDQEAAKWLQLAADQGDARAQTVLGLMYGTGEGVPKNDQEAAKWYRMAADQGYALAQFNLGLMYYHGEGVPKDYQESIKWYRKSAEQGDADAQVALGRMYRKGEGVPRDYVLAYMWMNVAVSNSTEEDDRERRGKVLDETQRKMTPEQISEAQKLSREWKPKGKNY